MTKTIDLRALIEASIEPTEPQDTILDVLRREFRGKRLDKKLPAHLKQATGLPHIWVHKPTGRFVGSTTLHWDHKGGQGGLISEGWLTLSEDATNVRIDPDWIEENNARWFTALRERNAKRRILLADANALATLEMLVAQLRVLKKNLKPFLDPPHNSPWCVVHHEIQKAIDETK